MARSASAALAAADPLLHALMGMMVASVASNGPDLTARQLAVLLKIYLEQSIEHTVRGLAAVLNISKPAITRALDRLGELNFTKRERDSQDRRSVIARRTPTGSAYLRTLSGYMLEASKQVKNQLALFGRQVGTVWEPRSLQFDLRRQKLQPLFPGQVVKITAMQRLCTEAQEVGVPGL